MRSFIIIAALFWITLAFSQGSSKLPSDINGILDRLEKRLQDEESEVLTQEEQAVLKRGEPKGPTKSIRLKEQNIEIENTSQSHLKKLASAVTELENDIEKLATEVQFTKQRAMQSATTDNFISIEAALSDPDKIALRTFHVSLDNHNIYSLNESSGLWMPTNKLPIFSGPLKPGKHQLKIEARLVLREEDHIPLNKSVHKIIQETYELAIPDGTFNKKWQIKLAPPQNKSSELRVEFKQD